MANAQGSSSEPATSSETKNTTDAAKQAKILVNVKVIVPQMKNSILTLKAYPYSTRPLKRTTIGQPLPEEEDAIKQTVLSSGYQARLSLDKPYPMGGWRWQYAYRNGLKRSGLGVPHTIFEQYKWANKVVPFVKPECQRINKIEELRDKRYLQAVANYEDNHRDEEMDALKLNQEPVELKLTLTNQNKQREGSLYLSPGEWWITGLHKSPGLNYYWQEPVQVMAGETLNVMLDDSNALYVQGGW
jgi:hypothetical protein